MKNLKDIIDNLIIAFKSINRKIPKKVKKIFLSILLLIIIFVLIFVLIKEANKQKYEIYDGKNLNEEKYPGVKELIDELSSKHPNWTFTLFYTKLDFEEVIENEEHKDGVANPLNLIPDSSKYPESWKCQIDRDKTFDNGTWLCASSEAIKHQMDPRNIINEENIFQFLELRYTENEKTKQGLEYITKETFLDDDSILDALIEAGKKANLNPYFIASRLIQEQGRSGTTLSKGYEYNGKIVYNPFNIDASGNSREEILNNGAKYAYDNGWTSLEKAIIGGIEYVKEDYINKGQNTLYLQKFDVVNQDKELYTNQYMQNLLAPESEAKNMKLIYEESDTLDSSLNFIIPLYENMSN